MQISALLDAKQLGLIEIYGVYARTRRVEPVRTFSNKEEKSLFRDFCDVLKKLLKIVITDFYKIYG